MTSPAYIEKLNKLNELREQAGKNLHKRAKLAHEIYTDQEYQEKIAQSHNVAVAALGPDDLAAAIDQTWPDLINVGFDWTGSHTGCRSLQTIFNKFPKQKSWVESSAVQLWVQCEAKREKEHGTRRSASIKDVEALKLRVKQLEVIIKRLEESHKQKDELITQLRVTIKQQKSIIAIHKAA